MHLNRKSLISLVALMGACQLPLSALAQDAPNYTHSSQARTLSRPASSNGMALTPVPGHGNAQGWVSPDFVSRRTGMHTIYVAPIEVQAAADSQYLNLSPDELAELNRHFRVALAAQLPPGMKLVSEPQPDSMTVNLALKQGEMKKDGFHLLNWPVGFLISHAKAAAGVSKVSFANMVVNVEAYDAQGVPLLALNMRPQGIPADPGSALNPADADPNQVRMSPVRLDQMPAYLAGTTPQFQAALRALTS